MGSPWFRNRAPGGPLKIGVWRWATFFYLKSSQIQKPKKWSIIVRTWKFQVDRSSRFGEIFLNVFENSVSKKTLLKFWEPIINTFTFPKLFTESTLNFRRILSNIFTFDTYYILSLLAITSQGENVNLSLRIV